MGRRHIDHLLDQHRMIAARMGEFSRLLYDQRFTPELADALLALIADISMHFGFEEGVMLDGGYADFEHHRRQHLAIVTELGLLLDRVKAGLDVAEVVRSADFVSHWYQQHIDHSDRLLEDWLEGEASSAG